MKKAICKIVLCSVFSMVGFLLFGNELELPKESLNLLSKKWVLVNKENPITTKIQEDGIIACECATEEDVAGVMQFVTLNQDVAKAIFFSAESKAENVEPSNNLHYSVYMDITYSDDTHKWGLYKKFAIGTHDWQAKSKTFTPEKPIKRISFYLLFRKHTGQAWFKNPILKEVE